MPMSVSPDKRYLVAPAAQKPFTAYTCAIDRGTGALKLVGTGPLAESFPYITHDRTGRWLLSASYGGHLVSVNPVKPDGTVGDPHQVIPTARNAHAIITDRTNRHVFVPHLGTDQVFQFLFDEKSGRLSASTPPVVQMKAGMGPRHLVMSPDNRFVYLLNELTATVTTLANENGLLREISSVSALPPGSTLRPGCRGRSPTATCRTTSGPPTSMSRRADASSMRRNGPRARSPRSAPIRPTASSTTWAVRRPRSSRAVPHRPDRPLHDRFRREVRHDLELPHRVERIATAPWQIFDGKGSNWVEIVSYD